MEPQKKKTFLTTLPEVNNIKISIADFKTIDAMPHKTTGKCAALPKRMGTATFALVS